jgi:gamma-glutamyltranspeptidase / glutathione hydrolase
MTIPDAHRRLRRTSLVTARGMAATSQPLATRAAVRCLEAGGNACDAAVCAAAVLCVVEPMSTGLGGDCFAIVHRGGTVDGLNASGRSPRGLDVDAIDELPLRGPQTITVPGAVAGWAALLERHGTWGLDRCLADAIDAAEGGFAVGAAIALGWAEAAAEAFDGPDGAEGRRAFTPVPRVGEIARLPELGASLRRIAEHGAAGFYDGPTAAAICGASWLEPEDLAAAQADWVEPLRLPFAGHEVLELPPNGQGAAALQALALAEPFGVGDLGEADRVHLLAEAMKLAFADAGRYLADAPLPDGYLDAGYVAERRALIDMGRAAEPGCGVLPRGGTVYLAVVDADRTACSFIHSVYFGFGSGVVAPGTGIALQNRGAGFTLEDGHPNRLAPGKRPFHTIIPGMLLREGALLGPFGHMGGHVQAQGHLQLVTNVLQRGLDPQQALDEPRWRLDRDEAGEGWLLCLEPELWHVADELERRGHRVVRDSDPGGYGGAQAILVRGDALVGGSEPRKDGQAAGY